MSQTNTQKTEITTNPEPAAHPPEDWHQALLDALRTLVDPEVGLNIVDLGLVRDLDFEDGIVRIEMTLTNIGCPIGGSLEGAVRDLLLALPWVKYAKVKLVFEPPWSRDDITPEGKKLLGLE